jgi:hypothetical protein
VTLFSSEFMAPLRLESLVPNILAMLDAVKEFSGVR